jgi:tRNA pseudouridine65 synthase
MLKLKVVKESASWVLVDKPGGFHTHPPEDKKLRISQRWNALGILERQLGIPLYPMHRLDRATSGLLLYSKDRSINGAVQAQFANRTVGKAYFALVRGTFLGDVILDSALRSETGDTQESRTSVRALYTFELPLDHPRGGKRTFTFVRAEPLTGRFHQIRRHMAGAGFPVMGDSRHGDRKLNREFAAISGCRGLLLRCMSLEFCCPETGKQELTHARWSREWHRLFEAAGACPLTASPSPAPPSLS